MSSDLPDLLAGRVAPERCVRGAPPGLGVDAFRLVVMLLACWPLFSAPVVGEETPPTLELAQRWEELSPDQRQRALQNFNRFQKLTDKSRERVERQYQRWQGLEPHEQDKIRRTYDRYRQMSPDERLRHFQRRSR